MNKLIINQFILPINYKLFFIIYSDIIKEYDKRVRRSILNIIQLQRYTKILIRLLINVEYTVYIHSRL